ncbi:MAG TPA: hypothetical protein VFY36_09875 [Solirubrobacteraceae bacterium]|nr:hypothetical protein [Solirubrobacteraceae bacterium]
MTEPIGSPLPPHSVALLRRTVKRHAPELISLVDAVGEASLCETDREALKSAVLSEFLSAGLDSNDEPTLYGLELEALIDALGHC